MVQRNSARNAGKEIQARRKALDLSRAELASRVGCATATLASIEQGKRRPSREIAELLARALEIPPSEHVDFIARVRGTTASIQQARSLPPSNLPTSLAPLIPRPAEIAELCEYLVERRTRLVSLVGPPGVGKTRLAIEAANEVRVAFDDGVCFVSLADASEPEFLMGAIGRALEISENGGAWRERIQETLRDKTLLLVLDNLEQLLDAAPQISELLFACPRVQALVTSRVNLNLYGEQEFPVEPFAYLASSDEFIPHHDELLSYPAVQLFILRVRQFKPRFCLTTENARAIVEICSRLEGLPLALELAAARLREFSPAQLAEQLNSAALPLTVSTARDVAPRQQTLRRAIGWSYALLDEPSCRVFRALAVFRGGFTSEAAAAVCANATRDRLLVLAVHNLIRYEDTDAARLTMLETLREFAWEQLEQEGELDAVQRRHAGYWRAAAERAYQAYFTSDAPWQAPLLREEMNLRAALRWCEEHDPALGLELAGALSNFWENTGFQVEGAQWLEKMLSKQGGSEEARARALLGLGWLSRRRNRAQAAHAVQESIRLYRRTGDQSGLATATLVRAEITLLAQEWARAEQLADEALMLAVTFAKDLRVSSAYMTLAHVARNQGHYARAYAFQAQAIDAARPFGPSVHLGWLLAHLANDARLLQDVAAIHLHLNEAEQIFRQHNAPLGLTFVALQRVSAALLQNEFERAGQWIQKALPLAQRVKTYSGDLVALAGVLAIRRGKFAEGIQLFAAAEQGDPEQFKRMDTDERALYEQCVLQARAALGDAQFEQAYEHGSALTLEQALALC